MNQKLIQVKKQLTFEEICPQWAQKLCDRDKSFIGDFTHCIVGEAHGFSMDYSCIGSRSYCKECYDYSYDFGGDDLSQLDEFVVHWNECHVTDTGPEPRYAFS